MDRDYFSFKESDQHVLKMRERMLMFDTHSQHVRHLGSTTNRVVYSVWLTNNKLNN